MHASYPIALTAVMQSRGNRARISLLFFLAMCVIHQDKKRKFPDGSKKMSLTKLAAYYCVACKILPFSNKKKKILRPYLDLYSSPFTTTDMSLLSSPTPLLATHSYAPSWRLTSALLISKTLPLSLV